METEYVKDIETTVELKICPFCGEIPRVDSYKMLSCESDIILENDGYWYYVFCPRCLTRSGDFLTIERAAEIWNKRYKIE